MADMKRRLSFDEEPLRPFMAEDQEMLESSSREPQEDIHHLSLMPPPRSSYQTSNATALPRDFDISQAPTDGDQMEEATTDTRRSSGDNGGRQEHVAKFSSPRRSKMEKWPTKKKLRVTMEQSALLEQCFKHHDTSDYKEKLISSGAVEPFSTASGSLVSEQKRNTASLPHGLWHPSFPD